MEFPWKKVWVYLTGIPVFSDLSTILRKQRKWNLRMEDMRNILSNSWKSWSWPMPLRFTNRRDDYDPWSDPGDGWGDYTEDDGWGDYF